MSASRATLLTEYLAVANLAPFSWSRGNCCHFVADWVRAATGCNPMQGLAYTHSQAAARRLVLQLGGSLDAAWTRRLGRAPLATPALAPLGDLMLVPVPEGAQGAQAIGICTGRAVALKTETGTLAFVPFEHATHAWRLEPPA